MQQITRDVLQGIDWGAVTIGVIALIFTAITLFVQRKHNRLSVKPIAIITVADYESRISVYLHNRGIGPLIIKKLSFTNENGKQVSSLIEFFGNEFDDVVWSTFTGNIDGWAVLPGKHETLLELTGDETDSSFITDRNRVRKILALIKVEIHYQDIYEQDMPIKTRPLVFFARSK